MMARHNVVIIKVPPIFFFYKMWFSFSQLGFSEIWVYAVVHAPIWQWIREFVSAIWHIYYINAFLCVYDFCLFHFCSVVFYALTRGLPFSIIYTLSIRNSPFDIVGAAAADVEVIVISVVRIIHTACWFDLLLIHCLSLHFFFAKNHKIPFILLRHIPIRIAHII